MPTTLQHEVRNPFSISDFRRAVGDRAYWDALVRGVQAAPGEVRSVTEVDDSVEVSLVQRIPRGKLPSAVTAVVSGDLAIERSTEWTFTGTNGQGVFRASVSGSPATMHGTITVNSDQDHTSCTLVYTGEVTVKIPFVGGKIEKLVVSNLLSLLDAEREFTVAWLADHA